MKTYKFDIGFGQDEYVLASEAQEQDNWNIKKQKELEMEIISLRERERVLVEKYNELIFSVGSKYPNESRHETALRYIKNSENNNSQQASQTHAKGTP